MNQYRYRGERVARPRSMYLIAPPSVSKVLLVGSKVPQFVPVWMAARLGDLAFC